MFNNQNILQNPHQRLSDPYFGTYYPVNQNHYLYNMQYSGYQQNYNYSSGLSCDHIGNNDTSILLEKRQRDEKDINDFIEDAVQNNDINNSEKGNKASKIAITKNALISIHKLNKKITSICTELKRNINISEIKWQENINICNEAHRQILQMLQTFKSKEFFNDLMKDIQRRKKKRLREKRKIEKYKNEKVFQAEKRARLHAEADSWIRSKQAIIDREKQEENLRKDADMILSDVRGKRNDVRKYLGLLQELQNLRNVKITIARARGEHLSSVADETFNNIIVKLMEQWSALDREYSLEEQGLKLMLKTDNEERIEKQKKNTFDEWENALFGKKLLMFDHFHKDLHGFIMIRAAWDKFINYDDKSASAIPIGWIVPEKPSSAAWQKCLKKEVP